MAHNQNLGILLLRAYEWFDDALLERMHASGTALITRPHSLIFSYLAPDGSRPADLARRIGISRQAVHATLNEMVALGLIELISDPADGRAKLAMLTERGKETTAQARALLVDIEAELAVRIGAEHVRALRMALAADWGTPGPPD